MQKAIAILLGRGNESAKVYTARHLAGAKASKRVQDAIEIEIQERTLVLDARMRGLTTDGLFDPKEDKHPPPTVDGDSSAEGTEAGYEDWQILAGYRIRRRSPEEEAADERWRGFHTFEAERTPEGVASTWLVVEKWHEEDPDENALSITRKEQSLEDHQGWAAGQAIEIVNALGLERCAPSIAEAIVLAAKFHDEGKRAPIWQRAFSAPFKKEENGEPIIYAKTRGPFRNMLHGYRHEFGSLVEIDGDNEIGDHPERDLILHLIAAHHGQARPVIPTNGCEKLPPSALEEKARDVALRFAACRGASAPGG